MTHFKFCQLHLFVTIASITTLISSCDPKNDNNTYIEEEALSAPSNFTNDETNKCIRWDAVPNAEKYYCTINDRENYTISKNHINLTNTSITEDQWHTITVQAIAPTNSKWYNSSTVNYPFIFTKKTLLATPTNFKHEIFEIIDPISKQPENKIKIIWDAVPNAEKYYVTFKKQQETHPKWESRPITESSFIPMRTIEIGHNYVLEICAIPKENSPLYVTSETKEIIITAQ